ncbi:MAG: hypothetical protein IPH95_14060 [Candidatus Promineofilum sp.]|nr:hypothetical protein [Promineifilum sp.]
MGCPCAVGAAKGWPDADWLVDRLMPLALLYIFFDVLATVIVIVRNLFA